MTVKDQHNSLRTLLHEWSKKVKLRDGYKCKKCGYDKDVRFLHAHHLKEKSQYPDLMFDINNGICVCIYCHGKLYHKSFIKLVLHKPSSVTKKEFHTFLLWQKENNNAKTKVREESSSSKYKVLTKKKKAKTNYKR